jgi:flagellar motor switch protein FliM
MNTAAPLELYDFHKPCTLADGVEQRLSDWQRAICPMVVDVWRNYVPYDVEMTFVDQRSFSMSEATGRLSFPSVAYRIKISGIGSPTLFVVPRPVMLALVTSILGDVNETLPDDRELTDIENSLSELLFQELTSAISAAWPEQRPIPCRLDGVESRPDRSRLLPPSDNVLMLRFQIGGSFGKQDSFWVLPQVQTEELLSDDGEQKQKSSDKSRILLEMRAREIPVDLTVRLGDATISVADLAHLNAGDVVVLDQKITDPLVAEVSGQVVFRGRPGRSGPRQAFQIEALL